MKAMDKTKSTLNSASTARGAVSTALVTGRSQVKLCRGDLNNGLVRYLNILIVAWFDINH